MLLHVAGAVATAAGLHTVIAGARSIAGQQAANASVESEPVVAWQARLAARG